MKTIEDIEAVKLLYSNFKQSKTVNPVYVHLGDSSNISVYTIIYLPKDITMICTPLFLSHPHDFELYYNNLYDVGDNLILINAKHKVFTASDVHPITSLFTHLLIDNGFTRLDVFNHIRRECDAFCPLAKKCKDYLKVITNASSLTLRRCDPTPFLSKTTYTDDPSKVWVDQLVQLAYKNQIEQHIKQLENKCNGDISRTTAMEHNKSKS